jgi:predicted RNA-binding protein YlqC (UPF0109 family)
VEFGSSGRALKALNSILSTAKKKENKEKEKKN